MPVVSPILALVAAVLFAISATVQQDAARTSALSAPRPSTVGGRRDWLPVLRLLSRLLRNPRWLLGWLLNVLGFAAHAAALHLGTIATVQVILVIQLMFVLLLRAAGRGGRPTRRDWFAAAAVCSGVAMLVLLRGDVGQSVPPEVSVLAFVVVAAAFVLMLLGVARGLTVRSARTSLVAVGAGVCFCVTAVLVVVVTHDVSTSGPLGALGWPLLGLIGSAVAGSLLVQDSFAAGSLPAALTAMTITDPVASSWAGALLFDAAPPSGLELSLGLPTAGALIVVGVALLANSPTLHVEHDHTRAATASV